MLRKLRRASQKWTARRRNGVVGKDPNRPDSNNNASFLGLPPEIRNQIYEHLAAKTTLTLWPIKTRKGPRPVGLLLACKQTYREYRVLMLSTANVVTLINSFDFTNVIRVLKSLPPEDSAAMRSNDRLCVTLFLTHVPSREERRSLLEWFTYRAEPLADKAINFHYDVQFNARLRPPRPPSRYVNGYHMRQDLLLTFVRRYMGLRSAVQELAGSTDELDRLLHDLQGRVVLLEELMNGVSDEIGDMAVDLGSWR